MKRIIFTVLLAVAFCFTALAGGYQVKLQGQKQTAMGLIGTPFSFGASSVFYNPGGLSFMQSKFSVSAGASGILANVAYQQDGSGNIYRTDNPVSTPFYLYAAGKIGKKITLGLGVYTPYGSTTKWEEKNDDGMDWAGRYLVSEISFFTVFVQPTIAYQINDKFSIGAGFIYSYGAVSLKKDIDMTTQSGKTPRAELDGTTSNIGFNIGAMFRPNDKLSIGVDYRSKIAMKMEDGDAKFYDLPAAVGLPADNKFDSELPLPANLDIGFSYKVTEKLMLAAEVNWVQWSTYKELKFTFKEGGALLNSASKKDYSDSWVIRLGGQYAAMKNLDLRLGAYYDPSPVNEDYFNPETVSLNTIAWTAGLSYRPIEKLSIDLSFDQLHGMKSDRKLLDDNGNNVFSGTYRVITNIPGIGVSFNF